MDLRPFIFKKTLKKSPQGSFKLALLYRFARSDILHNGVIRRA